MSACVFAQDVKISWIEPSELNETIENIAIENTAPVLEVLSSASVIEGELLLVELKATDIENDSLEFSAANAPLDSELDNNIFSWTPGYDVVSNDCWYKWITKCKGKLTMDFSVSDGENAVSQPLTITVIDGDYKLEEMEKALSEIEEVAEQIMNESVEAEEEIEEIVEEEEEIEEVAEDLEINETNDTIIIDEEPVVELPNIFEFLFGKPIFAVEEVEEEIEEPEETQVSEESQEEVEAETEEELSEPEPTMAEEEETEPEVEELEITLEEPVTEPVQEEPIEPIKPTITGGELITAEPVDIELVKESIEQLKEELNDTVEGKESVVEKEGVVEEEAPQLPSPQPAQKEVKIEENQLLKIELEVYDPDMDSVDFKAENLPEGSTLENNTFTWVPDYSFVQKKSCWYWWLMPCSETVDVSFIAADNLSETRQDLVIKVKDKNAAPIMEPFEPIQGAEHVLIKLVPNVTDIDNNNIKVKTDKLFDKNLEWTPAEGEVGNFTVKVTASDGKLKDVQFVNISVEAVESNPEITFTEPPAGNLTISETENVTFMVEAIDLDGDALSYKWFVNEKQVSNSTEFILYTSYNSAGDYLVYIEVEDIKGNYATAIWNLEVLHVNRAPVLEPIADASIKEGEEFEVPLNVSDADEDNLYFQISEPFGTELDWTPGYGEAGTYELDVVVTDGIENVSASFTLVVENVNLAAPNVVKATPADDYIEISETESLEFSVEAEDEDGDAISYLWTVDGKEVSTETGFIFETDYDSSGGYDVNLELSDGIDTRNKNWSIFVADVNRAPELDIPNVEVNEGTIIELDTPDVDADGDELSFTFSDPFDEKGQWETEYDDAGEYDVEVVASDGSLEAAQTVTVKVINVNRAPKLVPIADIKLREDQTVSFVVNASDEDNDDLNITIEDAPEGASFDGTTFEWSPGFDFASRESGLFGSDARSVDLTLVVSDGINETKDRFEITVINVNRAPVLQEFDEITVGEGSTVTINPIAYDPDNDTLTADYSGWMTKSTKKTSLDDSGRHLVTVTVSDGELEDSKAVVINVGNTNQAPVIDVTGGAVDRDIQMRIDVAQPPKKSLWEKLFG